MMFQVDVDVELRAPAQQLDVLQAGHALVHQLQHLVAEALDARLDVLDPGAAQLAQLLVAQVRLDLVEELQIEWSSASIGNSVST